MNLNDKYFVCKHDKSYVDAGYRWAYWTLEKKSIVELGKPVRVDILLNHDEYWNPSEEEKDDWLCMDILPTVKDFLSSHKEHKILYVDEEYIFDNEKLTKWKKQ